MSSSPSGCSEIVVAFALPPPHAGRRSSSSGRAVADDEERDVAEPVDEVVDEVEQAVVGPVEVLEHEHGRAPLGDRLEEATPGRGRGLGAGAGRPLADADERAQLRLEPAPLARRPGRAARPRRRSFRSASAGASLSRMPASALTISPSAQKVTPSP